MSKVPQKATHTFDNSVKQAGTQVEGSNEIGLDEKPSSTEKSFLAGLTKSPAKPEELLTINPENLPEGQENRCYPSTKQKMEASAEAQRWGQSSGPIVKEPESQETTPKKDPPPVIKKTSKAINTAEMVSTEPAVDSQKKEVSESGTTDVQVSVVSPTASSQSGLNLVDERESGMDKSEVTSKTMLSIPVPNVCKVSPPHTPPPPYHPTPPLSRKTPPSSVSTPPPDALQRAEEDIQVSDSCWPPPPPPMDGDSVFDGGDEVDFPPPPPLFETDGVPNGVDSCITEQDVSEGPTKVGETVQDSSEPETSVHEQNADLPLVVPQTEADNLSEVVMPVSEGKIGAEVSVNESVPPPPPLEAPRLSPMTKPENPVSASALVPPSCIVGRDSRKIEDLIPSEPSISVKPPIPVPVAPPLPAENLINGVTFRRPTSLANRDTKSKEFIARHKSAPCPKEDANIPLVTPSLLQMVRLRSVNMTEDQVPLEDNSANHGATVPEICPATNPGPQNTPQKPIRKSLSLKYPPHPVKTSSVTLNTPSVRLQEAIRMKTAAMSSRDGLPSRLGVRSPPHSCVSDQGSLSPKSPERFDMHKSPASTASFIFSRSTKKVVMETAAASSPETQASLKQSLAAELMQVSDQFRTGVISNGGLKSAKVPPPIAKKPSQVLRSPSQNRPACSAKIDFSVDKNRATGVQHTSGVTSPETTSKSRNII